jgi:hypothetical protein
MNSKMSEFSLNESSTPRAPRKDNLGDGSNMSDTANQKSLYRFLAPGEIRVLHILPGEADVISCRMEYIFFQQLPDPEEDQALLLSLKQNHDEAKYHSKPGFLLLSKADEWLGDRRISEKIPEYNALSYTWGDLLAPKVNILLNGQEFPVTENCYLALQRLRREVTAASIVAPVWIDAICIDQDNPMEKGRQVQMMDRIFKEAERVVVWLGVGMDGSDRAIDTIAKFYNYEHCGTWAKETAANNEQVLQFIDSLFPVRNDLSVRITELVSLAERSYWGRVWIVQEFHLAQDATIYCGRKSIALRALTNFCQTLEALGGGGLLLEGRNTSEAAQEEMAICQDGILAMNHSKMCWHCTLRANCTTNHDTRTLNSLLWELVRSDFGCKKPRDYIYALRGVASDINDGDIQCDYEKDIKEVYRDLLNLFLDRMTTYTSLSPGELQFTLCEKMGVSLDGGHEELIEQYRVQQGIQDTNRGYV